MRQGKKKAGPASDLGLAWLAILLALASVASLGLGAEPLSPGRVLGALAARTPWAGPGTHPADAVVVWDLRLARVLLAALVGAGLASAGAAFQGLFRNPLADPFVVGASGGAALGGTLAITMGLGTGAGSGGIGFGPVSLAAFAGALGAVALVYAVSRVAAATSATTLLLAGAAVSTMLSAAVSLVMALENRDLAEAFAWLMGGFGARSWPHLEASLPLIGAGVAALCLLARPLDALACGDETALSLGMPLGLGRGAVVAAASLATAAAVGACGIIGFVGLIAPHAARLLFGARHARLVPASALLGALLLVAADDIGRTVVAPMEIPAGIVTALLGAPFFLYLLASPRRALGGAWT